MIIFFRNIDYLQGSHKSILYSQHVFPLRFSSSNSEQIYMTEGCSISRANANLQLCHFLDEFHREYNPVYYTGFLFSFLHFWMKFPLAGHGGKFHPGFHQKCHRISEDITVYILFQIVKAFN